MVKRKREEECTYPVTTTDSMTPPLERETRLTKRSVSL